MSTTRFRDPAPVLSLLACSETLAILRSMSDCCWACASELAEATSLPINRVSEILSALQTREFVTAYQDRWLLNACAVAESFQNLKNALD